MTRHKTSDPDDEFHILSERLDEVVARTPSYVVAGPP